MKARILKKVCKRLKQVAPRLFEDSWIDSEICTESWRQGSAIRNIHSIGGETDEWGEGTDQYTLVEFMVSNFIWIGDFDSYPEGHHWEGLPNPPKGYKLTVVKMVAIAKAHG